MVGADTFNGAGIIVEIFFSVSGEGSCWIEIVTSSLSSDVPAPIAHDVENAYFSNAPEPPPPGPVEVLLDPPSIAGSGWSPSQNFTIDVNVKNVSNLYKFGFWISYNTSVLDINEVTVNSSFPSSDVEVLDVEGRVRVNASLTSPPGFSGDFTLASIEFHIIEIGETILDLYDISLVDDSDEPIPPAEPEDGYFNNVPPKELLEVTIEFNPSALNLNTSGNWVLCYVEFPSGYNLSEIAVSSIILNDTVPVDLTAPVVIGDYDNDNDEDIMVGFNMSDVKGLLYQDDAENGTATLILTGNFWKITSFMGNNTLGYSTLFGDVDCDGAVGLLDIVSMAIIFRYTDEHPLWNPNADLAPPYGKIDIYDLITCLYYYGQKIQ
jgi:hypothetical protein